MTTADPGPTGPRLLLFNLATDERDPVLGFAVSWVRALAGGCCAIDVVTMRSGPADLPRNVSIFSVGKEKGLSEARRAVVFYRRIVGLLRTHRYDACFAHMMPLFAVMSWPLLRPRGVPITLWYAHSASSLRLRVAEKLVATVATPSRDSFPLDSRKVMVTGHGIDHTFFSPGSSGPVTPPFVICSVGRLAPIKKVEELIEAVGVLANQFGTDGVRLRLVGPVLEHDRAYEATLRARVVSAGLEDVVRFVGPLPPEGILAEYRSCHVMVNLSDTDSLDKAVLEAMSCGVPVVTSNLACGRLLAERHPELVVPKGSPAEVAGAVTHIHSLGEAERSALGAELRELVVAEHSLDRLARVLLSGPLGKR